VYVFATFILQAPVFGSADLSARPIAVTFVDEHIASSLKMWICPITVIVDMGNKI
jgi:hypothetical protein